MEHSINPDSKDTHSGHPQPSSAGLFSSAKVVAGAAQSAYRHESFDKAKAAGAAEDILNAASTYGKLDDKGYGKYVDQAEDYLHKIRGAEGGGHVEAKPSESGGHVEVKPSTESGGGGGGGGIGDYLKLAEGIVHKNESDGKTKEGDGFGDYFKMAEGFLKK